MINKLANVGFTPDDVTRIILTHQDMDHIGNAKFFSSFGAKIYASKTDAPYINGCKKLVKYKLLKENKFKPHIEEEISQVIKKNLQKVQVGVDFELSDSEDETIYEGLKVINTPGHTTRSC